MVVPMPMASPSTAASNGFGLRTSVKKIDGNRFESAFGALLKVGNVTAGAERAWTAHKDDAADRIVRRGFAQRACHLRIHGLCQGILLFRTVHPDHTDAVLLRHYDLGHFFLKG